MSQDGHTSQDGHSVPPSRLLRDWVIGISVSEGPDLAKLGFAEEDVNRAIVRLSERLLSAGARLIFGHDWRPNGVMDAVCRFAATFRPPDYDTGCLQAAITNLLPWPDTTQLDAGRRSDLEQRCILRIREIDCPENPWKRTPDSLERKSALKATDEPIKATDYDLARAIGLTKLRQMLAEVGNARICLGGKYEGAKVERKTLPQGFYAGVIEEAYCAVSAAAPQPLYVSKLFGGASARLAEYLESPANRAIFQPLGYQRRRIAEVDKRVRKQFLSQVVDLSAQFDAQKIQQNSGLFADEWKTLLNAKSIDVFATLVSTGLARRANPRG